MTTTALTRKQKRTIVTRHMRAAKARGELRLMAVALKIPEHRLHDIARVGAAPVKHRKALVSPDLLDKLYNYFNKRGNESVDTHEKNGRDDNDR